MVTAEKSPVLTLPSDPIRIEQLERKLEEYNKRLSVLKSRLERNTNFPPKLIKMQLEASGAFYKSRTLRKLLDDKKINAWDYCKEMAEQQKEYFNLENCTNALGVIDDYCKTGGKNVSGGTGL